MCHVVLILKDIAGVTFILTSFLFCPPGPNSRRSTCFISTTWLLYGVIIKTVNFLSYHEHRRMPGFSRGWRIRPAFWHLCTHSDFQGPHTFHSAERMRHPRTRPLCLFSGKATQIIFQLNDYLDEMRVGIYTYAHFIQVIVQIIFRILLSHSTARLLR